MCKFAISAAVVAAVLALSPASAQQNQLAGTWRAFIQMNGMAIQDTLVLQPNGNYSDQQVAGMMMTMQTGRYVVRGNMISLEVVDWQPRTQNRYVAGAYGGNYVSEPTAKPPGGTYTFTFNAPNAMTWQDVNFHGIAHYQRVQ